MLSSRDGGTNSQEANGCASRSKRQYTIHAVSEVKDHRNACSCIVLPWCQSTCALTGIELARMHADHCVFEWKTQHLALPKMFAKTPVRFSETVFICQCAHSCWQSSGSLSRLPWRLSFSMILTMLYKHETCTSDYGKLCRCRTLTVARP